MGKCFYELLKKNIKKCRGAETSQRLKEEEEEETPLYFPIDIYFLIFHIKSSSGHWQQHFIVFLPPRSSNDKNTPEILFYKTSVCVVCVSDLITIHY